MRGAAQTWVIKLLLLFLALSFSIWGVGDMFRGNPAQRIVACIGGIYIPFNFFFGSSAALCTGEKITVQMLNMEFQRKFEMAQQKAGPDFTLEIARQLGFMDKALQDMIFFRLFGRVAAEFGLQFDAPTIIKQLADQPELRTADGKFDHDRLRKAIAQLHMNEAEFIDYMRDSAQRTLTTGIFALASSPPQTLTQQVLAARGQERLTQVLRLAHDAMPAPAVPDDEVLQQFHESHAEPFTAPEYRDISVLKVFIDDVSKNIRVSDQDIAAAFEARQGEFVLGERRDLVQVVVGDETKASKLAEAARSAKDLKKAADKIELATATLEDQTEQSIIPALYTNVFTAEAGDIIGPVKSDFGWHVIQLARIKPPYKPVLNDIKDKLREKIQRERGAEEIQIMANKIDDALGGARSLEDIGDEFKLPVAKFSAIAATGKTADGKNAEIPSPADLVLKNAFALNEGESSAMLDDRKGNFLVVHVDKIMASHLRPFAEIKDKVAAAWRADQQTQAAALEAGEIASLWEQKPNAFAELSARHGVTGRQGDPMSILGDFDKGLPKSIRQSVFSLKSDGVAVGADDKAHYIVRLIGFKAFNPDKNIGAQTKLKTSIVKTWRADILHQFESMLRQKFNVHVNDIVLDSVSASAENSEQ
ncbi:MAG: peptidyl-prolyl cis-trans isomerase [Alphaproteobacteria bacterium]